MALAGGWVVGKNSARDGEALWNDPPAVLRGKRAFDGRVPVRFIGFPAEGYPGAAIFIAGFEDQVFPLLTDKCEQFNVLAIVRRRDVRDNAGPRNVLANQFPRAAREKRAVF